MAYKIHKNGLTYECDTLPELIGLQKVLSYKPRGPHIQHAPSKGTIQGKRTSEWKPARLYGAGLKMRRKRLVRGIALLEYLKDSTEPVPSAKLMKVLKVNGVQEFGGLVRVVRSTLASRSMLASQVFYKKGHHETLRWHAGDSISKGINAVKQYMKEGV